MIAAPYRWLRRRAAIFAALFLLLAACDREGSERLDSARESLAGAFARQDITALRRAMAELREVEARTPEQLLELTGLMARAGETPHAMWLLEAGLARDPERDDLRIAAAQAAMVLNDPVRATEVLASVTADSPQHLSALMVRARARLELGDLDEALGFYRQAEALYPDAPQATEARIAALLQEGRVEAARSAIEAAARSAASPERARELATQAARIEFARGDRDVALQRMRELLAEAPDDVATRRALTRSLQVAGNFEAALEVAREGVARDPEQPALQALVAWAQALLGRTAEAEAALRRLAEQADSPSAQLLLARFLSFTDRPGHAADVLVAAARRHPDTVMLHMHAAEARLDANDLVQARAAWAAFRQRAPEDPHVRYLEARFVLAEGDAPEAVRKLRRVVSDLDRDYTQYWLAKALEATGDSEGAERRYRLALRRNRRHPAPALALVRLARQAGNWRAVAEWATHWVARSPADAAGYAVLATSLARAGEPERAAAVARVFVQRFPDRSDAPVLLAMSLRAQGEYAAADAVLDAAEAGYGPMPEFRHERALLLGSRGDPEAGMRELRRAIAERPDKPRFHASLAALAYAAGDSATGDTAVDAALAIDPTRLEPLELRATHRAARSDWLGAAADSERYLAARPRDADVHFLRGVVYEHQGRPKDAVASYRRAIQLEDEAVAARNNLALVLLELGEIEAAVQVANRAYGRAAGDPQVVDTLGWVYLHAGFAERSVKLLEKAHATRPESADTQLHLGLAYESVGRTAEARRLLGAVVAAESDGSEVASRAAAALRTLGD